MFGDGKSAERKRREKERKKRGTRKYGQGHYRHSRLGIVSCCCAVAGFLILAGCIGYAYLTRGTAAGIVGGAAVTAIIALICGLRSAVKGFKEREKNYLTCKIGLPVNAVVLLVFLAVFIGGLK